MAVAPNYFENIFPIKLTLEYVRRNPLRIRYKLIRCHSHGAVL